MKNLIEKSGRLPEISDKIVLMVRETFPDITFTDIWVRPGMSSYGDEVVEIWAIYEGDVGDLQVPAKSSFRSNVQDMLWEMDLDAFPKTHFITKSEAKDWRPEGV